MTNTHMRFTAAAFAALALGAVGCGDTTGANNLSDAAAPSIKLAMATGTVDSVLSFAADVKDNLGIKRIHIDATGGVKASFDSVFTSAVTTTSVHLSLAVPHGVPGGTSVLVIGTVYDGAGNRSAPDTLRLATGNFAADTVRITSPESGSPVVIGKSAVISITGVSKFKVLWLGFQATGAFPFADSTALGSPFKESASVLDTIAVPANAPAGALTVTPFIRDSLGNRSLGPPITLTVLAASGAKLAPTVSFGSDKRIEASDTIFVSALDPAGSGIAHLGYEVRTTPGGAIVATRDSAFNSNTTSQPATFALTIPATVVPPFPATVYVKAYAITANGAKGYAKLAGGVEREDTLTVVAGSTRRLASGGLIADAFYHPRRDRIYLTNIERNQIEVFSLQDFSFHKPISVGSRPWGITVWPHDRNGNADLSYGDTLLVAHSGGTSIGYVDISDAAASGLASIAGSPEGREVSSYALPNLIAYTVTTVSSATAQGGTLTQRTRYDFSDRPQYVAATCKPSGSLDPSACGDVVLVYSTTATPGQSVPFSNQGTVRWENLSRKTSHLFFEPAMGQGTARSDTLEIVRYAACSDTQTGRSCVGADSVELVPSKQIVPYPHVPKDTSDHKQLDSAYYSVTVQIDRLAFRDTTFVRNSGNFRRAIMGEGGPVHNSRAIGYDVFPGLIGSAQFSDGITRPLSTPVIDAGISRAEDVTDFIANTSARVAGVGINFDGSLSAVRADSIYLLDTTLRLQGTLATTTSANAGFDFHPGNTGFPSGGGPSTSCYVFAASTEPMIEVYDSHYYRRVSTIPLKAPIIGPIKSSVRRSTGDVILVGATAQGVVVVTASQNDTRIFPNASCPQ